MLDIHEKMAGDISHRLEPYSHERSVEHFVQFFDVWGIDISRDRTEALVQHLEGFSCAEREAPGAKVASMANAELAPGPATANSETPSMTHASGSATQVAQLDQAGRSSPWVWLLAGGVFVPTAAVVSYLVHRRARLP